MKKYIYKITLFLLPLLFLISITEMFYITDQGDLLRLGFLFDIRNYRENIDHNFNKLPVKYKEVSNLNLKEKNEFTVMIIGDSFSEQADFGYKNYLANQDSISVVHMDRYLSSDNPIQTLINIANSDILEKIKVDFIVLQSVERHFVARSEDLNTLDVFSSDSLEIKVKNKPKREKEEEKFELFSDKYFKVPYINFMYNFSDKPYESKTYKVNTTTNLFTNKSNALLFYQEDINNIKTNNDSLKIIALNETLEQLHRELLAKNINLIVLPSPDKYDVYYDFIQEEERYPKPLFFDYFNSLHKSYYYIDSKKIISELIKESKDVYYYDDTHWSPITAEKIGFEIAKIIQEHKAL